VGPNFVLDKGYRANTAIRQFRAVVLVADDQCSEASVAASFCLGICQDEVATADANKQIANIRLLGISFGIASAAVARMARLAVTNDGRLVTTTTAGQAQVGIALSAAAAAGDWFEVLLTPGATVPA
jgi:hypothetical protein